MCIDSTPKYWHVRVHASAIACHSMTGLEHTHHVFVGIVCIGVSTSLSKTPPPSFLPSPPLNLQTVQTPLFRQSPYILVFCDSPPLKLGFSMKPQNISFSSFKSN